MNQKTMIKAEPRIRFNWGYHDGASAMRRGISSGWVSHFDKVYEAGYWLGRRDQQEGYYAENSDNAWTEYKLGKVAKV